MANEPPADLTLIMRQHQQIMLEIDTLRHAFTVLSASVQRLDGTVQGLVGAISSTNANN